MLTNSLQLNPLCESLQDVFNGKIASIQSVLAVFEKLSPSELDLFFASRLYGFLLHFFMKELVTFQYANPIFLDKVTELLYFLLTKQLSMSEQTQKERNDLYNVLKLCTSRDATRFYQETIRSYLMSVCGREGETVSSIAWFYREYCIQWIEAVLEKSILEKRIFTENAIQYFVELVRVIAQNDCYRERATVLLLRTV